MIGIYKITNTINNLVYIGQSVDIERRWKAHRFRSFNENSREYDIPLYKDIREYGLSNFKFEIIEECEKDKLNEREMYWIEYYDSFYHGYNESFGGTIHCRHSNISKEKIIGILNDLKHTNMKHKDIAKKWDISVEMVQGINTGRYWKHNTIYPIQKKIANKKEKRNTCNNKLIKITSDKCPICGKDKYYNAKYCLICSKVASRKVERPSKDELLDLIKTTSFVQIGKMYGVSDNAVRKWCKHYDLPYKKDDIKKL